MTNKPNRYSTEVVTDLGATRTDVVACLNELTGMVETDYVLISTELVDSDTREKHASEFHLVVFETPFPFTNADLEEMGVDRA